MTILTTTLIFSYFITIQIFWFIVKRFERFLANEDYKEHIEIYKARENIEIETLNDGSFIKFSNIKEGVNIQFNIYAFFPIYNLVIASGINKIIKEIKGIKNEK